MRDYLFIDMHMHSIFSDEDLCDESPDHILEKVQNYCDKFNEANGTNVSCAISITDHNSVLGSREAKRILARGKYPNVKLIAGAEFTIDLCEVNDKMGIEKCFTRCHLLGYNFDENNKELVAYSKLTHKRFSNEDNIGLQLCAARRLVCEKYNTYIPFADFERIAQLPQNANYVKEFMEVVKAHFNKNGKKFDVSEVYSLVQDYLISARTYCEEATAKGRLKLSEALKLVNEAGGNCALAHPGHISLNTKGMYEIIKKTDEDVLKLAEDVRKRNKDKKRIEICKLDSNYAKVVLDKFLNAANAVCEHKIEGIETHYNINYINRNDYAIHNIAQEKGMFETGGSDYHGENFASHKTIGNCFQQFIQRKYGQEYDKKHYRGLFLRVANLPYIDYCVDGDKLNLLAEAKYIDENFNPVSAEFVDEFISRYEGKPKEVEIEEEKELEEKFEGSYTFENEQEIRANIVNLISLAENFTGVLNKDLSHKQRRKKLVALDVFCQSIYTGLKKMQEEFREHNELFGTEEYKQITKLLKEIHRKYYEMERLDNGIIYDLQKSLKKQYGIQDTTIDKIANITIKDEQQEK